MPKTKTKKKSPSKSSNPGGMETDQNLDQVRDILFGGQMRAVESRLARMEERLLAEQEA